MDCARLSQNFDRLSGHAVLRQSGWMHILLRSDVCLPLNHPND
jgi:hypothetical protein